ncbi:MAG: amino acid adenylation domain-containing protein [Gammaproteobacteria bacterium]
MNEMSDLKNRLANLSAEQRAQLMRKLAARQDAPQVAEDRSALPLSFSQQRLWFLDQLEPGAANYNISRAYRISGPLDIGALRRSLNEIIRRHESLRTTFAMRGDVPAQVISPEVNLEIPILEIKDETALQTLIRMEVNRPFDLEKGPLIRAHIMHLWNQEHVLLVNQHHIISDGWSLGIFIKELNTLYATFVKDEVSPLTEIGLHYADFSAWQQRQQGALLEKQLHYWKEKLSGSPVLELPADRPRPPFQSYRGALHFSIIPPALTNELKLFAQRQQATLFMLLMAVFQVLIYRYSSQEDFTVGSPIAGRNHPELEGVIGLFVNTLVLRADLSGSPSFREVLERVRRTSLEAFTHQELPFEKLVETLLPQRDMSRNPLFQIMFALQNTPPARLNLTGVEIEPIPIFSDTEKFDLSLSITEDSDHLECTFSYNTDLFDRNTVERMAGHFETLLRSAAHDPDQRIAVLTLLSERERHLLLTEWNDTRRTLPTHDPVHILFERQAHLAPKAVALVWEQHHISYGELNGRANHLAHFLRAGGVAPDTLIGLCLERSVEMVIAILGTIKAGAAYVPLDPLHPRERLSHIIDDAQIAMVLCSAATAGKLPDTTLKAVQLDSDWTVIAAHPMNNPPSQCKTADAAYVIYTSGSTGTPKGVVNTHLGILNRLLWMQQTFGLSASDAVLQKTPYTFDVSVWEFLWPLLSGARLVLARHDGHKDSEYLASLIKEQGITVIHFVPSMLQVFLDTPELERQCASLRYVMCSGEALSPELVQRYYSRLNTPLHNLYGPTEAAIDVTHWPCPRRERVNRVPIGKPIANTTIYLLDGELNPVPVGVAGELHIGGVQVARGYLNRPELTRERFIKDPFSDDPLARLYKSGDLARYLPDGNIEYLGRSDFQVKLRGFRIELGEIESLLRQQPSVKDCVAIVREDTPGDQRLTAYIIPAHGDVDTRELKRALKAALPEYMIPAVIVSLDTFPLTTSGKTDRRALPSPVECCDPEADGTAAHTPLEAQLIRIWAELMSPVMPGIHDNFFELGGHSLLATRVIARINRSLSVQLPLRAMFENPTITGLAQRVLCLQAQKLEQADLAIMLNNIEALPDEEAKRLAAEKMRGYTS